MDSTSDIFPCDLDEPILIPGAGDFETANESIHGPVVGQPPVESQGEGAEEWEDIT